MYRPLLDYSDREFDLPGVPELDDDWLLALTFRISEYIIGLVGPLFWASLLWLFFLAEFEGRSPAIWASVR
jgi:hypothetical protein